MKKITSLIFAVLFAFMLASCAEDTAGVSVSSIDPVSDLGNYTPNNASLSDSGTTELMAAMMVTDSVGDVMDEWFQVQPEMADVVAIANSMGGRLTAPTAAELEKVSTAITNGGDFNLAFTMDDVVDLSKVDGSPIVNGSLTVVGDIKASGSVTKGPSSISGSGNVKGDIEAKCLDLSTNGMTIPAMIARFKTDSSVDVTMSDKLSVSVNVKAALVYGVSISEMTVYDTSGQAVPVASGKYVYTITVAETVTYTQGETEPVSDVKAKLNLTIYDNSGTVLKSYEYDQTDLEAFTKSK